VVAREGKTGIGIVDDHSMAKKEIIGPQQLAEVTLAHEERRNGQRPYVGETVSDPLLPPVPKNPRFAGIEFSRDVERTGEIVTELVVAERGDEILTVRMVASPGVGIEGVIAQVFVSGTVEHLRTRLGDDADLATGCASVFR